MEESRRREFIEVWDLVIKIPFLKSIGATGVAEIARMLRRLDFPEDTIVVREGTLGDCMYFVAQGEVVVEREPTPIHLDAGCFFGEMALLGDYVRNATVVTIRPSTLLVLDAADFRGFAAHHPEFSRSIEEEAVHRTGAAIDGPILATADNGRRESL
jgi:voltage-gated potassium channel